MERGGWYTPIFLAQINHNHDLNWFYYLKTIHNKKFGIIREFKGGDALKTIKIVDSKTRNRIWESIQRTVLIIIDPTVWLKRFHIEPIDDNTYKLNINKQGFIFKNTDYIFRIFEEKILDIIIEVIIQSSPFFELDLAFKEIGYSYNISEPPNFSTKYIQNLVKPKRKNSIRAKIINLSKLVVRSESAFFELRDDENQNQMIENLIENNMPFIPAAYYCDLIKESLLRELFFDDGHDQSINILNDYRKKINNCLPSFYKSLERLDILSLKSDREVRIQAADCVARIARNVYENSGIKGLKNRFSYIIYNGEKF